MICKYCYKLVKMYLYINKYCSEYNKLAAEKNRAYKGGD
jgi:hypothetical protein